jgi:hypothetical protein
MLVVAADYGMKMFPWPALTANVSGSGSILHAMTCHTSHMQASDVNE